MSTPFRACRPRKYIDYIVVIIALGTVLAAARLAAAPGDPVENTAPPRDQLIDNLPSYIADHLPWLDPDGKLEISVRPRLGDIFHTGYIRVPVGVRYKVFHDVEVNTELTNYFSKGSKNYEGSGIAGETFGAKLLHLFPSLNEGGVSAGFDFRVPYNHSPLQFTDGYRHYQPYVAGSRLLVPKWNLYGYGNLAANFFEHTRLPSNFGRNQLHANSLAYVAGVAREWNRFQVSLTARLASTYLTSDEGRQNFQLRPEVAFPLRRNLKAPTQVYITLGGRVIWGPDGRQTNTNGGVRVDFRLHRKRDAKAPPAHFPS